MIIIKDGNTVEAVSDYKNLKIEEEINDSFSISLDILNTHNNKHIYQFVKEESIIEYDGYEYRIKQLNESRYSKSVVALSTFFDLRGIPINTMQGGTITIQQAVSFIMSYTDWTYEIIGEFNHELVPNFGNDNVLALIWVVCDAFDCDIKIDKNNHLIIGQNLGLDDDFQFRYKHNIKTLSRSVDTTNFGTRIIGRGGDGLVVEYVSALEQQYEQSIPDFKPIYAEEVTDDRITQESTMLKKLKETLIDEPDVNIELETIVLGEDRNVHDKIWLIYEPLNIEFKTNIIKKTTYPHTPHKNTVELGKKKTGFTDLLTETNIRIDENNKEVRSRIEQTNDRITLEVEEIGGILTGLEISVGQITTYVENEIEQLEDGIANNSSLITQTASQIRQEVNQEITRLDGELENNYSAITQSASEIRQDVNSEITRLDGRVDSSNSSITQLSNSITFEVNSINNDIGSLQSQVNIQAGQITSKINSSQAESIFEQKAGSFTFTANQINFNGAVFGGDAVFTGTLRGGRVEGGSIWIDAGAPDFLYSNAMDTNPLTQGTHVYIRPTSNGEARATVTNTTNQYVPMRASKFYAQQGEYFGQGNNFMFISSSNMGSASIYSNTYTADNQHIRVTSSGTLGRISSSRRYKLLEEEFDLDYAKRILNINPKNWFDKRAAEDYAHTLTTGEETENQLIERIGGIIAEDVHDNDLKMFVNYDKDNRPEGISHNLWILLLPIIKDLASRIENLEAV